jgi:hypothetical protein
MHTLLLVVVLLLLHCQLIAMLRCQLLQKCLLLLHLLLHSCVHVTGSSSARRRRSCRGLRPGGGCR